MATVPRLANAVFFNWKDTMGGQANGMWTTADQSDGGFGPFAGLASAAQMLSVSGLFGGVFQTRTIQDVTPVVGVYGTVSDQVVFVVQSENRTGQIVVPAPVDSIFLSDGVTVDLDNGLVTAWWGAASGILGDSYGAPWTQLKYGYRRKINLTGT